MSPLATLLGDMAEALAAAGTPFALVGGLAVSVHAEPRFTRDVDLAVAVADDAEAENLVRSLSAGYEVLGTLEHDALQRLAAVRLARAGAHSEAVVDLLFASSGIEPEVAAASTRIEVFPGMTLPVARRGHLMALKLLARDERRPQDDVDLRQLLDAAAPDEVELATAAVDLIVQRGANRERPLRQQWQELLARRG